MITISDPTPLSELIVEGMPSRTVKALTTTAKKAETLEADGYRFARTAKTGIYECYKPALVSHITGEVIEFDPYIINVTEGTCTCPQFAHHGHCKHERAARVAVSAAIELLLGSESQK